MDALLTYLLFKMTLKVMVAEFLVMLLCCFAIIIIKIISKKRANKRIYEQKELSESIQSALFPVKNIKDESFADFKFPKNSYDFRNYVEVLESFEQRFTDENWTRLKNHIIEQDVLKLAKKGVNARSWITRQLAARTFLLSPKVISKEELTKLFADDKYLVRVVAAVIITKNSYRDLFFEMIKKMSEETPLSQFPYRDALVQADLEKFHWIEEKLPHEKDPKIIAIALDVLSTRSSKLFFNNIKPFIISEDQKCRLLAIKAIGSINSLESSDLMLKHLEDSDWEVRAECIQALKNQRYKKAIPEIAKRLNDPIWWVRLQSALALESFGEEGRLILETQDEKAAPLAHEIAAYTLSLSATTGFAH